MAAVVALRVVPVALAAGCTSARRRVRLLLAAAAAALGLPEDDGARRRPGGRGRASCLRRYWRCRYGMAAPFFAPARAAKAKLGLWMPSEPSVENKR